MPPSWEKALDFTPDELLIHSDWERMPAPEPPPVERAIRSLQGFIEQQRWKRWSAMDWLYALTFLSVGIGIVAETARVIALAKEAAKP